MLQLEWTEATYRLLTSLPVRLRSELIDGLRAICEKPELGKRIPLDEEETGLYSLSMNSWRVVYSLLKEKQTLRIEAIRPIDAKTYLGLP
ncbi:MAG: hypothetical protein AAF702_44025 [Chloroflexota bacterium]